MEAAEEAHHQHEDNPDLQVSSDGQKKRKAKKEKKSGLKLVKMWCVTALDQDESFLVGVRSGVKVTQG